MLSKVAKVSNKALLLFKNIDVWKLLLNLNIVCIHV